eukprot:5740459-Prymnesium_polylepis.1
MPHALVVVARGLIHERGQVLRQVEHKRARRRKRRGGEQRRDAASEADAHALARGVEADRGPQPAGPLHLLKGPAARAPLGERTVHREEDGRVRVATPPQQA